MLSVVTLYPVVLYFQVCEADEALRMLLKALEKTVVLEFLNSL